MMKTKLTFAETFKHLTGNAPFPWQERMYAHFIAGEWDEIKTCQIPTGLGKTSVVAVWLIALATHPEKMPRRLVYVVNRRTVVDQTTDEVEKYRNQLVDNSHLSELRKQLSGLCALELNGEPPLALSTLRGQFADNREWSTDPCRPAVIAGTVDMIGSRLLFSGYGIGFKSRPLHAGFLGQDALLVHDEAHLEPAFQALVESIRTEQSRCNEFGKFHVMELTATSRGENEPFTLKQDDNKNKTVLQRMHAAKKLHLEPLKDPKKLAEQIASQALQFKDSGLAVLVFVRTVEDVLRVRDKLPKDQVAMLTGTLRGKERDELVSKNPAFKRFLPKPPEDAATGTVYLVCTSAGEVGVNISADHLVCDLSTFESMAQRFGRVNRFGNRTDTEIHVICSTEHKEEAYKQRLERTLELLKKLDGNASPDALGKLPSEERSDAFAPTPTILPTSDMLFDAWALTSVKGKLPGRPSVEPYLHGLPSEWQPPETQVAWRQEVEEVTGDLLVEYVPAELLSEYPLKPHELLREPSYRAFDRFAKMAKRLEGTTVPVWLLNEDGSVEPLTLSEIANKDEKDRINGKTVILSPSAGGLSQGMLDGDAEAPANGSLDVADEWRIEGIRQRIRGLNDEVDEEARGMHEVIAVRLPSENEDDEQDVWRWFRIGNEGDRAATKPVLWEVHVGDVERNTARIVDALPLSGELKEAVKLAAKLHDHGKLRGLFQRVLGNANYPRESLAKSGNKRGGILKETYRHEFGSLLDAQKKFAELEASVPGTGETWDLVLHLIATHHGRARPHFPSSEVFDPENTQVEAERIASEVPRRFARLQRKYGRWGLAYLESLLRAGDWAASSKPSEFVEEQE